MSIFHEKPTVSYRRMRNGQIVRIESYPATTWRSHAATIMAVVAIFILAIAGSGLLHHFARASR